LKGNRITRNAWLGVSVLGASLLFVAAAQNAPKTGAAAAKAAVPGAKPAETPTLLQPEWLFPIDPNSIHPPKTPPTLDDKELLTIPDSDVSYTQARIGDQFNAPDWHPNGHIPMPDVVAKGRKPDMIACAFCHTPTGQGRPENSALAALPEAYLKQQLLDYRSGARKPTGPEAYKPGRAMLKVAQAMTDKEIDASASYFSQQKLGRRVWIIESLRIPRAEPAAWIYEEVGGTEDLEDRLLEVAPDIGRHERRDDRMEYTAYVPPGSLRLGKQLATATDKSKTQNCATCHGTNLKGLNNVPPIAGRSPTYLLRQLLAFKNGSRTSEAGQQMAPVVANLELNDMIALAAYVASLYP
jgi:cytochrome c553